MLWQVVYRDKRRKQAKQLDGVMRVSQDGMRAALLSEKKDTLAESTISSTAGVAPDLELDLAHYSLIVGEPVGSTASQTQDAVPSSSLSSSRVAQGPRVRLLRPTHRPAGLSRGGVAGRVAKRSNAEILALMHQGHDASDPAPDTSAVVPRMDVVEDEDGPATPTSALPGHSIQARPSAVPSRSVSVPRTPMRPRISLLGSNRSIDDENGHAPAPLSAAEVAAPTRQRARFVSPSRISTSTSSDCVIPGSNGSLSRASQGSAASAALVKPRDLHELIPLLVDNQPLEHRPVVPDEFSGREEYIQVWRRAVAHEIQTQVDEVMCRFHCGIQDVIEIAGQTKPPSQPSCSHGPGRLVTVRREGTFSGRQLWVCPQRRCAFAQWKWTTRATSQSPVKDDVLMRRHSLCHVDRATMSLISSRRRRDEDDDARSGDGDAPRRYIFAVNEAATARMSSAAKSKSIPIDFRSDDLWLVSSSPYFLPSRTDWVLPARSMYYGVSSTGKIMMQFLADTPPAAASRGRTVYLLHCGELISELKMLDGLSGITPSSMPTMPALLRAGSPEVCSPSLLRDTGEQTRQLVLDLADQFAVRFHMNQDQASVLNRCATWFLQPSAPFTLVHGVFGAGKTRLLVALVLFITELAEQLGTAARHVRVLIAAATNTAVDQVLQGLLAHQMTDFVRVGSVPKMARAVLPHALSCSRRKDESTTQATLRDLEQMLKDNSVPPDDRPFIVQAINDLKQGHGRRRELKLQQTRVLGTTCHASDRDLLRNQGFPIVFLDEASQVPEPMSLLPLSRFRSSFILAVGDPKQLPPQLRSSEPRPSTTATLTRPLFERLALIAAPIMLSVQYRCHPSISAVANHLFYESKLSDGISADEVPPVMPGLPPLLFVDVPHGTEHAVAGSWNNSQEANVCTNLVHQLVDHGVAEDTLGVVSLYRSQSRRISTMLNSSRVLTSTVDAFQGGEKDVILLSSVRTSNTGQDFIDEPRRLNVALTRARKHLIIVGNCTALCNNPGWRRVIAHVREHGVVIDASAILTHPKHWVAALAGGTLEVPAAAAPAFDFDQDIMDDDGELDAETLMQLADAAEARDSHTRRDVGASGAGDEAPEDGAGGSGRAPRRVIMSDSEDSSDNQSGASELRQSGGGGGNGSSRRDNGGSGEDDHDDGDDDDGERRRQLLGHGEHAEEVVVIADSDDDDDDDDDADGDDKLGDGHDDATAAGGRSSRYVQVAVSREDDVASADLDALMQPTRLQDSRQRVAHTAMRSARVGPKLVALGKRRNLGVSSTVPPDTAWQTSRRRSRKQAEPKRRLPDSEDDADTGSGPEDEYIPPARKHRPQPRADDAVCVVDDSGEDEISDEDLGDEFEEVETEEDSSRPRKRHKTSPTFADVDETMNDLRFLRDVRRGTLSAEAAAEGAAPARNEFGLSNITGSAATQRRRAALGGTRRRDILQQLQAAPSGVGGRFRTSDVADRVVGRDREKRKTSKRPPAKRAPIPASERRCSLCRHTGHTARDCPSRAVDRTNTVIQ